MRLLKKTILLVLTCVLLCTAVSAADAKKFSDVPNGHWAAESIGGCSKYGLMEGVGSDRFGLGLNMSRAAYVTALCRLMEWEMIKPEKGSFADNLQSDMWYYSAVETAYAHGVLTEQSENCRPNDAVTREEMAVMSVRALGYTMLAGTVGGAACPFKDVSTNQGYVTIAYQMGIVKGVDEYNFDAGRTATREEAATILLRVFYLLHDVFSLQYVSAAPDGVELVPGIISTSGSVPLSPRAPLEYLYSLTAGTGKRAVAINAVPYAQNVKNGVVSAGRALSREEFTNYLQRAKLCRSDRYECSYLICREEDGSNTVVWFESERDIQAKAKLCRCIGVKELYVVRW